MKRFLRTLQLAAAFTVVAFFGACSNSSSTPPYWVYTQLSYFTQEALSHRAYIGGSLIYNPDNITLSQLAFGARIAVRTSDLEKKDASLFQVAGESDLHGEKTVPVAADGTYNGGGASESFGDYISEIQGSEVFGYITINYVSKDAIGFVYSYYPSAKAALSTQSCALKLGESVKLGKSSSTVKYTLPQIARRGFENARWLTFENSDTSLTACMYSCMPEVNGTLSSLYGVNSENDFIYIVGNTNASTMYYPTTLPTYHNDKISYGDYIVNQDEGKMYAFVGDGSISGSTAGMKGEESFGGNPTKSEDFVYYAYRKHQFPDPENGPKAMFDALPKTVQDAARGAFANSSLKDSDLYVQMLNWTLCKSETFVAIADKLRSDGNQTRAGEVDTLVEEFLRPRAQQLDSWARKLADGSGSAEQFENANESYVEGMRNLMDEVYDQSPQAYVAPPSLFNVYPDIALDIGNPASQSAASNLNLLSASWDAEASKSLGNVKSYNEYVSQRDAIESKFSEFHRLDLASVNNVKLDRIGITVNFAFGVKGKVVKNLGIKSGELGIKGLGAAVFMKAEASLQNIDLGEHSFFDEETRKKMEKELASVKFAIGPIPCIFKTTFKLDFGWTAKIKTNAKYMAGVTALYGGEVDLGAKWGVKFKWKIIPVGGYFKPWPTNAHDIVEQAFYVGPAQGAPDVRSGLDLGVYARGTLVPQVGVGVDYISAGVEVKASAQPEIHFIGDNKFLDPPHNTPFHLKGLLRLSVGFGPYFEVTIPIIGKKIKTEWTAIKIVDKGSESSAIELFDEPIGL